MRRSLPENHIIMSRGTLPHIFTIPSRYRLLVPYAAVRRRGRNSVLRNVLQFALVCWPSTSGGAPGRAVSSARNRHIYTQYTGLLRSKTIFLQQHPVHPWGRFHIHIRNTSRKPLLGHLIFLSGPARLVAWGLQYCDSISIFRRESGTAPLLYLPGLLVRFIPIE